MPYLRADKWIRAGAGLSLGLLLVAQGKVWPWLLVPPERSGPELAGPPVEVAPNSGPPSSSPPASPRPRSLPHLLPDNAPAPRWPAHGLVRTAGGARDGVVSCGPQHASGDSTADGLAADGSSWRALFDPLAAAWAPRIADGRVPPADPAVRTSIFPIGPPRA